MKHKLPILISLILIVGCTKEPINYYEVLNERYGTFYTKDTDVPYSGPGFSLYQYGQKKEEGTFVDGRKNGLWTEWYENGQKKEEGTFVDNDGYIPVLAGRDGLLTRWYENGQKKEECFYKQFSINGVKTEWYESGQRKSEGFFKDGKKNGLCAEWYENGQKKVEGRMKPVKIDSLGYQIYNSQQVGKWIYYNEDGTVKEIKDFGDG